MICPKCKGKNSNEAITCQSCGLKLKTTCPRCKHKNKLGRQKCENCGLLLIRICPECKTKNFPHIKTCRKCGFELIKKKPVPQPEPESQPERSEGSPEVQRDSLEQAPQNDRINIELKKELSRNDTVNFLQEMLLKSEKGYIVSLSAPEGLGKSTVITTLSHALKEEKILWLWGMCEPFRQNSPYSFFQDLFCTLFGLPVFSLNNDEIKKSSKKIFESNLGINDQAILNIIYRIILNDFNGADSSIEKNRNDVHRAIAAVITAFNQKGKLALTIDDFEYIDSASFECIKYLLKLGFIDNNNFLIINHTPAMNIAKYFPAEISAQKMLFLSIKPLSPQEIELVMLSMLNNQDILPENLKSKIARNSKGLAIYIEQSLWYLFQTGAIYNEDQALKFKDQYKDIDINPDLAGLLMQRLSILEKASPDTAKVILTSAVFGLKFVPKLVELATELKENEMQQILQLLINSGLFAVYNQYNFGFKHTMLWKIIFERSFNDELINEISRKVISTLEKNTTPKSSILIQISELAGNTENLQKYYNNAVMESFCLGDLTSYTNNQAKLLEMEPDTNKKLVIAEQTGKVNYEANPPTAIHFLKECIKKYEEQGNMIKVIELTGYLSRSCEMSGNYQGVLDCSEKALSLLSEEEENPSETILLRFSRLDATFNLGRLQEVIMTAENETLPFLSRVISKKEKLPGLTVEDLKEIEYQTELILAKAYTYQGNIKSNELSKVIIQKAQKEGNLEYEVKALLNQALFLTIQGDLRSSEEVLDSISDKNFTSKNPDQLELEWLFISILAHLMNGHFEQARTICYTALPLAKEYNNYNIFSILKLLNGMFYQYFNHYQNAIAIYDEVAHYCSETKMATGALFSWYFAAEAELETGNPERAEEIAERALDITQKPNINNYIAAIMISRLIAETKTIKGDFEGAQIYIENGIDLAEKNQLTHLLTELYLTFGKIYQENANTKENNREHSANYAKRLYSKALSLAEKLDNSFLINRVEKEISNLNTFCKLSGVTLEG